MAIKKIRFNTKNSIKRAGIVRKTAPVYRMVVAGSDYSYTSSMEKVNLIREGLPYESIEVLSKRADLPIKKVLSFIGLPQTTYNKKKRDKDLLSGRDSELVIELNELMDLGLIVFNNETEKFQRWLKKPNLSLGGVAPESLFDSLTGIQEVRNSLNRLEFGNLA